MGGKEKEKEAYRDLNEPEGWSVSILRKILLLRFRRDTFDHGRIFVCGGEERRGGERGSVTVPSCGLGQSVRFPEGSFDPGAGLLLGGVQEGRRHGGRRD